MGRGTNIVPYVIIYVFIVTTACLWIQDGDICYIDKFRMASLDWITRKSFK